MGWKGKDPYEGQHSAISLGETSLERLTIWLATGCGIGLVVPVAPGTFGSIPGLVLAMVMACFIPNLYVQSAICLALTLLAVPVCTLAERLLKKKDDGRISADEWMLYPIALIGIPILEYAWLVPVTFVVIRVLDIIKLPPARQLQYLPEGWGIVADDFISQLFALGVNHVLVWWLCS